MEEKTVVLKMTEGEFKSLCGMVLTAQMVSKCECASCVAVLEILGKAVKKIRTKGMDS